MPESRPRFPLALRGYDRDAVDAFVEAVERDGPRRLERQDDPAPSAPGRLDRFGERVQDILVAAEEAAEEVRESAEGDAAAIRASAAEDARQSLNAASTRAENLIVEADRKAEKLTAGGLDRRRALEAEIAELITQRDRLAADLREMTRRVQLVVAEHTRVEEEPVVAPMEPDAGADNGQADDGDAGSSVRETADLGEELRAPRFRRDAASLERE